MTTCKKKVLFFLAAFLLATGSEAQQIDWVKQVKNKPLVDVRMYGAKGDGTTNDTAAIQAAITAASPGESILFSAGSYKVTNIAITKPLDIYCQSTSTTNLTGSANSTPVISISSTLNVTIRGCTITSAGTTAANGISITNSTDIRITDNHFSTITGTGVSITKGTRVWVLNNRFSDITYSGVRMENAAAGNVNSYIWVQNNSFKTISTIGTGGQAAVQTHDSGDNDLQTNLFIENNLIESVTKVGIGLDGADYSLVRGNRIMDAGGECIAFTGSHNIISDNIINNCASSGVMLFGVTYIDNTYNQIHGNVIWDAAQGIGVVWGENGAVISNLLISNNTAFNTAGGTNQTYGVQSYYGAGVSTGTWSDIVITGNNLVGNATGPYNLTNPASVTIGQNLTTTGVFAQTVTATGIPWVSAGGHFTSNSTVMGLDESIGTAILNEAKLKVDTTDGKNLHTLRTKGSTGLLLQNSAMSGAWTAGGLQLQGGGLVGAPSASVGGVFAGTLTDTGTYNAAGTSASGVLLDTGGIYLLGNTSLTPGTTYSPSILFSITPTAVKIPQLKSTTGTRYLCIGTDGTITSSATACSGT